MKPTVRVVGRGKPMPLERYSDTIPSGRFAGGDHVGFEDAHAEGVDFSGRRFEYLQTVGSTFVDCDFSGVVLKSGALSPGRQSRFIGCRFDGIRPGPTIWGISRFEGCSFERLRLKGWDARACEFVDCRFSGRVDSLVLFGRLQPPYDEPTGSTLGGTGTSCAATTSVGWTCGSPTSGGVSTWLRTAGRQALITSSSTGGRSASWVPSRS